MRHHSLILIGFLLFITNYSFAEKVTTQIQFNQPEKLQTLVSTPIVELMIVKF